MGWKNDFDLKFLPIIYWPVAASAVFPIVPAVLSALRFPPAAPASFRFNSCVADTLRMEMA
jgi:hypothetical protein